DLDPALVECLQHAGVIGARGAGAAQDEGRSPFRRVFPHAPSRSLSYHRAPSPARINERRGDVPDARGRGLAALVLLQYDVGVVLARGVEPGGEPGPVVGRIRGRVPAEGKG